MPIGLRRRPDSATESRREAYPCGTASDGAIIHERFTRGLAITNSAEAQTDAQPARTRGAQLLRILLIAAAVAAVLLLAVQAAAHLDDFRLWIAQLGVWGPVVFIVGYALAVIAFVPGSLLTLAAGTIFGVAAGTAYVLIAAVLGSSGAFFIARYLARDAVERRLEGNRRFAAIDAAVADQGLKIVTLLRLSPAFPFSLLNYALGLTRVRFLDYSLASLAMVPATLLYVYSGAIAGQAATAATGGGSVDAAQWALRIVGLIATLVVTIVVTRIARRALKDAELD